MKKRTMERNVLYFMPAILQHAEHYKRSSPVDRPECFCGNPVDKKTGGKSRLSNG
jgi:hypothetical protein